MDAFFRHLLFILRRPQKVNQKLGTNLLLILFHWSVYILENWRKINDAPVCFGARYNTYGTFHIKESGLINTVKLVHKSGSVVCHPGYPASYWGCDYPHYGDKRLLTVITYQNKNPLLLADYLRDDSGCEYYLYQIDGIGVNSTELVFNKLPTPLSVSNGQEFQIWYGQDLKDCSEHNNAGQTCSDVYAWYM